MKLNRNDIEELVEKKYILMNKHPELDLFILNYSKTAQYEKVWNEYTLMARGLVVDANFNVIANPFPKFFNIEEHEPNEIPYGLPFEVFEKMDGSLGILFYYNELWHVATRGSFTSDQAIRGLNILNKISTLSPVRLNVEYTYLVEIIYPENRIVVNYNNEEDLVLLGAYNNVTGLEIPYDELKNIGLSLVKRFDGINDVESIRSLLENDTNEGVIVRFSNGFRVKIKWSEYCRLHRIVTNVSTKTVWEYLKDNNSFEELLEKVPDEFYDWVEATKADLIVQFSKIELEALKLFWEIYIRDEYNVKKAFALKVNGTRLASLLFKLYDGKSYDHLIWKMIEPKFAKPFADEE